MIEIECGATACMIPIGYNDSDESNDLVPLYVTSRQYLKNFRAESKHDFERMKETHCAVEYDERYARSHASFPPMGAVVPIAYLDIRLITYVWEIQLGIFLPNEEYK